MSDDEGNYSELETGSENSEGEQDYGEDAGSDIDEHTLENNYNDLLNEKICGNSFKFSDDLNLTPATCPSVAIPILTKS